MQRRRASASLFESPVLTGAVVVLVLVIGVYISYGANKGLPFVPTYNVKVNVPDAAKLVAGDAVHIGGARVGQVTKEQALPGNPPYAQLTLALSASQKLPIDTTVEVRPLSILGEQYLAITKGQSKTLIPPGGVLGISHAREAVQLTDAFKVFDPSTRKAIQSAVNGLGDAFAGRGADVNQAIGAIAVLLPPLERVTRLFISPQTDLPGFINGLDATVTALAPVSTQLAGLFDGAATTFEALQAANTAYGQAIDQLPATETLGTNVLTNVQPVLRDAATIAREIRPGTRLLGRASARLATALEAGVVPLRRTPTLAALTNQLDAAVESVDPPASQALSNNLKELSAANDTLVPTLALLLPAQTVCNLLGVYSRNTDSTIGQGNADGTWLTTMPVFGTPQSQPVAKPSANLHIDPYPNENANGCDAGNEPYTPAQKIGPPSGTVSTKVDQTSAPASATALGQQAGLLTPPPGARP